MKPELLQCVRILPGADVLRHAISRDHRHAILAARGLVIGRTPCGQIAILWRSGEMTLHHRDEIAKATLGDSFP